MKHSINDEVYTSYVVGNMIGEFVFPFIIGGVIWVMMRKKYNIIITLAMPVLVLSLISFMQSFGSIFK